MKLNEFSNWNDPEYIESCNKIISNRNCRDIEFCIKCPFHWHNLTKEFFSDCTEYSDTNDCILQDSKLVQSAKEFLELVKFQRRVESTTAKSVIEESDYLLEPLSNEEIENTQAKFITTSQEVLRKEEEYIIVDQNSCICSEVNTLKLAEEFVNNSLQKDSSNTFTIYKKIKTGKAKVNVETEWCE